MNKFVISRKYYMRGEFFMNNKISKYFFIILMIVFIIMLAILIYIKSSASDKSKEYATLKEKGEGEIIYLDDIIINSLNKLNNISYSRYSILIEEVKENDQQGSSQTEGGDPAQNKQEGSSNSEDGSQSGSTEVKSTTNATDQSENKTSRLTKNDSLLNSNYGEIAWNEISYSVETLFAAWPTITLDMKTLNVKDEDISNFSVTLDGVAQSIKNKDKNSALINLYNLYTMLPRFLSYFINDDAKINLYNTKAYLLNAYISADKENWQEMNSNVDQAINSLQAVVNSNNTSDNEKSILDKAGVLLQELKRGISVEDKEIFYLKYKLAIEQLEIL